MVTSRFATTAAAVAIVACQDSPGSSTEPVTSALDHEVHATHNLIDEKSLTAAQRACFGRLRHAVSPMGDPELLKAKGWDVVIPCRCKQGAGSQGVHHIDTGMAGAGTIDPLQPTMLMYETPKNGKQRLIGVEWSVPLTGETPPEIHGLPFHRNTRDGRRRSARVLRRAARDA
jgi:hypothetical protein